MSNDVQGLVPAAGLGEGEQVQAHPQLLQQHRGTLSTLTGRPEACIGGVMGQDGQAFPAAELRAGGPASAAVLDPSEQQCSAPWLLVCTRSQGCIVRAAHGSACTVEPYCLRTGQGHGNVWF